LHGRRAPSNGDAKKVVRLASAAANLPSATLRSETYHMLESIRLLGNAADVVRGRPDVAQDDCRSAPEEMKDRSTVDAMTTRIRSRPLIGDEPGC
jgi:hypothetical protein